MPNPFRRVIPPGLVPGRATGEEMDAEIAAHLEFRIQDLVAAGMTPEAARAEALRRFGDLEESRRRLLQGARRRDSARRNRDRIGALSADLRFAWRQAMRSPVFTAIIVATLAIGIGLTSATYALLDHVLLRPLPFPQPERLVVLSSVDSAGGHFARVSSANWQDWRRESRALQATAVSRTEYVGLRTDAGALRVPGQAVSGAFFDVLRPRFLLGRPFREHEVEEGTQQVVVSERLWRTVLGADSTLAAPLRGVQRDYAVLGVVAAGHGFPEDADVWRGVVVSPPIPGTRNNVNWYAIGRLADRTTLQQATADLAGIAARIRAADPSALYSYGVNVRSLKSDIVGEASGYLQLLVGAVVFLLLIACANVAAANVARGTMRARELAVRAAIGAGRRRLMQQLLVEHALLAAIAGAVGVVIGWAVLRGAIAAWGHQVPRAADVRIDGPVLAVTLGITLIASVASSLVPALLGSRSSLSTVLASGGGSRGATRGGRAAAGRALVTAQIAIAVLLLSGSALLIRSFRTLVSRDLGFAVNVATVQADLTGPEFRTDTARRYAYWDALQSALRDLPGVTSVGLANWTPLSTGGTSFIEIEGSDLSQAGAGFRVASVGYHEALSVPLIAGRFIETRDVVGAQPVTVINQAMADRYWAGRSPLGQRVRAVSMEQIGSRGGEAPWRTIVGVVGNVRHWGFDADMQAEMYVPHQQSPFWSAAMTVVVRAGARVEQLLPGIRARARAVHPGVAVEVGTLARRAEENVSSRRMTVSLLGLFGVVSLLLAALGTYGLLSYSVAQRTRELAVRAALGATRATLIAMIVGNASLMVALGVVFGVAGALALTRFLESQLVEISRTDPLSFAGAIAIIVVAALMAALVPAMRASSADPADALRAD